MRPPRYNARVPPHCSSQRLLGGRRSWPVKVLLVALIPACSGEPPRPPVPLPVLHQPALAFSPPPSARELGPVFSRLAPASASRQDARLRRRLLAHLAAIAAVGPGTRPESFPSQRDVLAYLVNAHMAWAVALATEPRLATLPPLARRAIPFPLDGTTTTLEALAAMIIQLAPAEPRFVLFLNPGLAAGPPLPPWPVEGHALAWQLEQHARTCGAQRSFWDLDEGRRELRLSAFAGHMPGLPPTAAGRALRLLELVPPPPPVRDRILTVCGPTLQRCTHTLAPLDPAPW